MPSISPRRNCFNAFVAERVETMPGNRILNRSAGDERPPNDLMT
jgi:hypothetical protein